MQLRKDNEKNESELNEDEIFKSLSHNIRRIIIKVLGEYKFLSFTDIKNKLGSIESPSLSYHLKSLKFLVKQGNGLYSLTELGDSAYLLINRINQADQLKKNKKKFLIANIITILCWTTIMITIPISIKDYIPLSTSITVSILLNVLAQLNFFLIFRLWSTTFKPRKKKMKNLRINSN